MDLREVYFLILHFLSNGPCDRTFGPLRDEILEKGLLPRRYHSSWSRSGTFTAPADVHDDAISLPLTYDNLVERYPHIEKDHLVKLLKQLILNPPFPSHLRLEGHTLTAADVPTLLGSGSFSLVHPIFDRSGRYVITGSDDRLVKIWSMETALCLASCRGHEGDITDLAVSSNNALVASASNDFVIRVWRLPDGMPISVLRGHTGAVTAIAFSPRQASVYQLLSSSDDGTCRIWDARYSQWLPRIYVPNPLDAGTGKSNFPSSNAASTSNASKSHQILCCAYNANGTIFVTGSSDSNARVWSASKSNLDDAEQPTHELDVLRGHENDVNYVQFRFCHDNIVTCSRDGSAIIWTPRSRKFHGKSGRWTKGYHLKVPPPPLPPQPPRGGPRQRLLPTPRGVNMIIWSLDNRFVLAAIMDCRICVWNAADGSLVHCLTGHSESSYVLDVHPFNPRIAMSAGYDGKTIIWDIWEGIPIKVYDIGRFKLVDGKFSQDGTSIVLSDEVGQIYFLNTGQGESQKAAKYDQFFLGDYRPLIRDTNGHVLDQVGFKYLYLLFCF
uniref:BRWD/PHIP N-terminal domain-containing protein n=1 Tax=Brassica campestris TaxID=3711 RepID=M4DY01_BRACM